MLQAVDRPTARAGHTLEMRLQMLYPDATGYQNVVRRLEQLVHDHQQARAHDDEPALKATVAQILWWLGYDVGSENDSALPVAASKSGRVFVVDDAIETIKLVDMLLVTAGYEVESALSGRLALKRLRAPLSETERPNLILLDLSLPDLEGTEVYRRLQADESTQSIPVVFFSGRSRQRYDSPSQPEIASACGYLQKPFKHSALLETVSQFVSPQTANSLSAPCLQTKLRSRENKASELLF